MEQVLNLLALLAIGALAGYLIDKGFKDE